MDEIPAPLPDSPLSPAAEPTPPKRWRRWLRRTLAAGVLLFAVFALYQALTWPDVAALVKENPETTAFIEHYRRRAAGNAKLPAPRQRWVPYSRISNQLKRAVLVAEDIDFFSHHGFAVHEIKQALDDTLQRGESLRGASTVSQQLVKNLWLSPSRNPWRKVKEALLTWQLERTLSKRRILELYLNVVEFGPGVYGAEAAAQRYFGTTAAALSPTQAAALAAALPNPTRWYPGGPSDYARRRTQQIANRVVRAAWLEKEL